MSARIEAASKRLGLTEGQAYTVTILLVVAALLLSSLTGLTGRIADVAAQVPEVVVDPVTPGERGEVPVALPPVSDGLDLPDGVDPDPAVPEPGVSFPPAEPLEPEEPPAKPVCASQGTIDTARTTLTAVDDLVEGVVPDASIVSALAIVTGCSAMDPAILLLASLIEVGQSMPDLGLGFLDLPPLPFLALPDEVIALAQPARPVLDPICGTVGLVNIITSQASTSYQDPFNALFGVPLYYAFITCGQIAHG